VLSHTKAADLFSVGGRPTNKPVTLGNRFSLASGRGSPDARTLEALDFGRCWRSLRSVCRSLSSGGQRFQYWSVYIGKIDSLTLLTSKIKRGDRLVGADFHVRAKMLDKPNRRISPHALVVDRHDVVVGPRIAPSPVFGNSYIGHRVGARAAPRRGSVQPQGLGDRKVRFGLVLARVITRNAARPAMMGSRTGRDKISANRSRGRLRGVWAVWGYRHPAVNRLMPSAAVLRAASRSHNLRSGSQRSAAAFGPPTHHKIAHLVLCVS